MPTSQQFNLKFQNRVTAVIHFSTRQFLPCPLFWPLPLLLQFTVSHIKGTTIATELELVPIFSINGVTATSDALNYLVIDSS